MKIYLDNCALGRPEDKQKGLVKKQSEAVLDILEGVRQGRWQLMRSSLHDEEASSFTFTDPVRRSRVFQRLDLASHAAWDTAEVLELYHEFRKAPRGRAPLLKPKDGMHLATAAMAGAAVFVTVDRKLYLWARAHRALLRGMAVGHGCNEARRISCEVQRCPSHARRRVSRSCRRLAKGITRRFVNSGTPPRRS